MGRKYKKTYVEEMGFEDVNRVRSSGILLWGW